MEAVDIVGAAVVGIALLRGLFSGLVRSAFSLGSFGGACIAVMLFSAPLGGWLESTSDGGIGAATAPWIAGVALAVTTATAISVAGRLLQRGVRAAGFSWVDRMGGAILGAALGVLLVAVGVWAVAFVLGRDHASIEDSHSLRVLERLEVVARTGDWRDLRFVDVAAPPPRER